MGLLNTKSSNVGISMPGKKKPKMAKKPPKIEKPEIIENEKSQESVDSHQKHPQSLPHPCEGRKCYYRCQCRSKN